MEIRQATPAEAHAILGRDAGALPRRPHRGGVRGGHPAGARNVPVVFFDPATRQPRPNPDFVATVERQVPRDTKLLVGCQSGGRSQRACEILAQAGYADLTNVQGGFGGARDASGRIAVPGWRDEGLPVEMGPPR
jgi:rhodanese-related sulfurtransferase